MEDLLTMLDHRGLGSQVMKLYLRAWRRLTGGLHSKDQGCIMQTLLDIEELEAVEGDKLTKELYLTIDRVYAGDNAVTIRAKVEAMTGTALESSKSPLGESHLHAHTQPDVMDAHTHCTQCCCDCAPGKLFAQQAAALETMAKAMHHHGGDADEKADTPDAQRSIPALPAPTKPKSATAKRKAPETNKAAKAPAKKPRLSVKQTPPPAQKFLPKNSRAVCKNCNNDYDHYTLKRDAEWWASEKDRGGKGQLKPAQEFSSFYGCMCGIEVSHFESNGWVCKGTSCRPKLVRCGGHQENGYTCDCWEIEGDVHTSIHVTDQITIGVDCTSCVLLLNCGRSW